jgi:hypothetical protein
LAANSLAVGDVLRIRLWGVYSTAALAPTLTGKIKFGSTTMLNTGALTAVALVSDGGWSVNADFTVTAIGAGGTVESQGYAEFATAATTGLSVNATNTAAVSLDTTASQAITVTVQWSASSASNSITLREMSIEQMRVASLSGSAGGGINARLTLTSGTPVTTADVTGATNVYWTPYGGNTVTLWNGSAWTSYTLTEVTIALGTITNARPYDVFGFVSAGAPAAEILAWTSDTARATAVTLQDGRYCKSGDKTRLYLGTFRTTSTTTTEDSAGGVTTQVGGKRFLWNYYNRVARAIAVIDTTASWSYTTNTVRQANAASGNKVEYVCGIDEDICSAILNAQWFGFSSSTRGANAGIGLDSTTTFKRFAQRAYSSAGSSITIICVLTTSYAEQSGSGYHYLSWNESGADGTSNFAGLNNGQQCGLQAWIKA